MSGMIRLLAVLVVLCVGMHGRGLAQDIPDNIPDGPRSVPERQRETLKERHRGLISRFFTSAHLSAAPTFNRDVAAYGVQVEAGFDVTRRSAIYFSFGVREYVVQNGEREGLLSVVRNADPLQSQKDVVTYFAANYDVGLSQFMQTSRFTRRAAIGMGLGGALGTAHLLTVEVAPKYVIPIDSYWSLPVGLKIGQAVLGADRARVRGTYVGLSVGVKMFYGHRDALK